MQDLKADGAVALFAGHGDLPIIVADSIAAQGDTPIVFALNGATDPADFSDYVCYDTRWGQLGRVITLINEHNCTRAILVGKVQHRPDFTNLVPDFGAIRLLPRILKIMRAGDNSALSGAALVFAEHGVELVGPLSVAPGLAMPLGNAGKIQPNADELADVEKAVEAARVIGELDIGQAAVAVGGRVVAVEGAEGTDGLLQRIGELREAGFIPKTGGVLAKCMKPNQDPRLDVPAIGPTTALRAAEAGLSGVAADAERTMLIGYDKTIEAFESAGLFFMGVPSAFEASGDTPS